MTPAGDGPEIPFLGTLAGGSLRFGTIVLVEFQPNSLWFEAALTIVGEALRAGVRVDFHTFQHPPDDARRGLEAEQIDASACERAGQLRIIDSYSVQTGLHLPGTVEPYGFASRSLRIGDWKAATPQVLDAPAERRILHLDENSSVLVDSNSEEEVMDFLRTRAYEGARRNELLFVHSLVAGVHSERFYRGFETMADTVVDFRAAEESGHLVQQVRARTVRGRTVDSRWRTIAVRPDGRVAFGPAPPASAGGATPPAPGADRSLAAVMFLDMVGFTALAQADEQGAMAALDACRAVVRRALAEHGGVEIKTMGDAVLAELPSALAAVRCAVAIQEAFAARTSPDSGPPIGVRIGVHVGDVIRREGDILGDAVNLASRIEPLAPPGGLCISRPVFEQVWNKVGEEFVSMGLLSLKNVRKPMEVYRWDRRAAAPVR